MVSNKMNKVTKLKMDFPAIFWTKFQKYKLIVFKTISTLLTYCNCKIRKIGIGSECEFYGVPTLKRVFLAEIKIGKKCRFRSDTTSNLVGINRKCIIATIVLAGQKHTSTLLFMMLVQFAIIYSRKTKRLTSK